MPVWLIVIITILLWSIWPGIVIVLHVSEERRTKNNKSESEKNADDFLNKLKKDGK